MEDPKPLWIIPPRVQQTGASDQDRTSTHTGRLTMPSEGRKGEIDSMSRIILGTSCVQNIEHLAHEKRHDRQIVTLQVRHEFIGSKGLGYAKNLHIQASACSACPYSELMLNVQLSSQYRPSSTSSAPYYS